MTKHVAGYAPEHPFHSPHAAASDGNNVSIYLFCRVQDLLGRIEIILEEVTNENRRLRQDLDALRESVASMATGYTHEVQRGETLAAIAAQYGVTVADIVQANGITNPNVISVGQELVIPAR